MKRRGSVSGTFRTFSGMASYERGRTGSKHHLITDATGIPLAAALSGNSA